MKIYYIANARIPTEKAHGIQIAKMCEAFIEAGADITLVVPNRATEHVSVKDYYNLRVDVPIIYLPALDWYTGGRIGYALSSLSFMVSYVLFILKRKMMGNDFLLYTVDIDSFSSCALGFLWSKLFSEMHSAKRWSPITYALFSKASGIIAINQIIVDELRHTFTKSNAKYLVEPNGVDVLSFPHVDKSEARRKLGLPTSTPIVMYTGRLFEWKGLEILSRAALLAPELRWQIVGGTKDDFGRLVKEPLPSNLFFAGGRPHSEMPLWLAAADVVVVLGTVRDIQSYRYTSPMKLFEYLATGQVIVASRTPAICQIVTDKEVLFYEPDSEEDLARRVKYAVTHQNELGLLKESALLRAKESSWKLRAERVIKFIENSYAL